MILLIILNALALIASISWVFFEPSFEPAITSLALTASLYALNLGKTPLKEAKQFIESVIFRKEILSDLPPHHKREALLALVRPSNAEEAIYPNIEIYYHQYIEKFTNLGQDGFRSNYSIKSHASVINEDDKHVVTVTTHTFFRLYPTQDGYQELIFFLGNETIKSISLQTPDGDYKNIIFEDESKPEENLRYYKCSIDELFDKPKYINLSLKLMENFDIEKPQLVYKFFTPVDGFHYKFTCEPDLTVKSWVSFLNSKVTRATQTEKSLDISFDGWVNSGEGIIVLLGVSDHAV